MQFQHKKTKAILELIPKPAYGKVVFEAQDGVQYEWGDLEPIRFVAGVDSTSARNLQIKVPVSARAAVFTRRKT